MAQPRFPDALKQESTLSSLGFFQSRLISYFSKKARLGINNRESSRLNRGRIFGMVRSIFTELGQNLYQKSRLDEPRDVFYLNMDELFAYGKGAATGEVVVVTSPVPVDAVRGKILVARTTDPGWVFLLAVAKGVIAEKGSLLSHTAIITRELGLPSVVGVENATEI